MAYGEGGGGNFAGTGGYSGNFGGYGGASNQSTNGGYGGTGGWGGQFGAGGFTAGLTGAGGFNANGLGNGSMYGSPNSASAGSGWGSSTTSSAARARQEQAIRNWQAAGTAMHPDAALGGFGNINHPLRGRQAQLLEQIIARRRAKIAAKKAKKTADEQLVDEGIPTGKVPETPPEPDLGGDFYPGPGGPRSSFDTGGPYGMYSSKQFHDRIFGGGTNSWGGDIGDKPGPDGIGGPGYGTARQFGGPVGPGQSYTVGENGPETLQMNAQGGGQVIPHNPADQAAGGMNPYDPWSPQAATWAQSQGWQNPRMAGGPLGPTDAPLGMDPRAGGPPGPPKSMGGGFGNDIGGGGTTNPVPRGTMGGGFPGPTPMNNQPLGGMDPNALRQMFQLQRGGGSQGGQPPQAPPPTPTQPSPQQAAMQAWQAQRPDRPQEQMTPEQRMAFQQSMMDWKNDRPGQNQLQMPPQQPPPMPVRNPTPPMMSPQQPTQGGSFQGRPMPQTQPPQGSGGFLNRFPIPSQQRGGGGFGLSGLGLPGVMGQLRQRQGFGGGIG